MIFISYRGIFDGTNYEYANTPNQIGKAFGYGVSVMTDVWRVNDKFYLGTDQPLTEVSAKYLQGNRWWINARNTDMINWLGTQSSKLYPNWFYFNTPTPPPPYVTASNGKLITPGTVPINNNSVIFLPEINDRGMFSTVKLKCFGICSTYLNFIRRMRNEGVWY
ncbi:MAG: hypothetical protein ACO3UU_12495 [Minisyncoccia bacterium]